MIPSFLCIPHIPVGHAGGRATQEQLPTTAWMQEVEQRRSSCRGDTDRTDLHGYLAQTKFDNAFKSVNIRLIRVIRVLLRIR